jgi:hypothetical protein
LDHGRRWLNGPHGDPFIWLLRVGSLIKDPLSNWIHFLPGVRGVWGFKMPDNYCNVSSHHHSINQAFNSLTAMGAYMRPTF